ncbi:MAG: hypothetical protein EBT73_04940 [Actinobacteria bacterium]|nr:hypothetical protein [Actinomycetota bacterium]
MARLTYALVVVEWHDAHTVNDWTEPDEIDEEPFTVISVGHLIPDRKPDHVVLAQSVGADGALDGLLYVPVGMVKNMRSIQHD